MNVVLRHVLGGLCITVSIMFLLAGLGVGVVIAHTQQYNSQYNTVNVRNAFIFVGAFIVIPAIFGVVLISGKEDVSKKRNKAL